MEKKQFKAFCKKEFEVRGFKKVKKTFYLIGKDLLCGIELTKSNYGNVYYIDFFYCIGDYSRTVEFPDYYKSDIQSRVPVMSKTSTIRGEHFITAQIEYEEYTEEELRPYLDKAFEERILPPCASREKVYFE